MDLLKACYEALPTLWLRSSKLSSTLGCLMDAVAHVNPLIGQAATDALQRFATATGDEMSVVLHITRWLFVSEAILQSDPVVDLMCEHQPMLELWLLLVSGWAERMKSAAHNTSTEAPSPKPDPTSQLVGQIEAGGLFLICSAKLQVRELGLKVLRIVANMPDACQPEVALNAGPFRLAEALQGTIGQAEYRRESERSLNLMDEDHWNKWLGLSFLVNSLMSSTPSHCHMTGNSLILSIWNTIC
ncbi:hypothetical protein CALVIDRAFT_543560 [Calocera viscosa TUFC12733]|uniref:Cell morphogenesis protein N-terminal domain-containing protein n=1 Tax=Calocera viscosa (strain TUFC12733) TaxID=1330018 RepID=A0A167FER3_CALVF|nr:hypothetical protein CALVIDRAFT_543560 [Calocera viscosa TUFC12733]